MASVKLLFHGEVTGSWFLHNKVDVILPNIVLLPNPKCLQDHIGSLNWNYRVQLRDKAVDYHNYYAEFIDAHRIKVGIYFR